jgi:flagellar biosynthetic protein FlhB
MDERRTEQASPRKLARARSRGVVARSPQLCAGAAVLAFACVLPFAGERLLAALRALVMAGLAAAAVPGTAAHPLAPLAQPARDVALALAVPLAAAFAAAALAGVAQVGPLFSTAAIAPDLRRLDASEQLRTLLSGERWVALGLSALKLAVLLAVAVLVIAPSARGVLALPLGDAARAAPALLALLLDFVLRMGATLLALGALDLVYQRVQHARRMRMSAREVRDELRESHGVPEQRERRRRLREEQRVQAEIGGLERARVLLVDGSGRALALAFDAADRSQHAPRIVAKGEGAVALRMRAWAEHHALPSHVQPALLAALFPLELTEPVPSAHYAAAAELFAAAPGSVDAAP